MAPRKLYLSVWRAFVKSAGIPIIAAAFIPLLSAYHRVFEGSWRVNWRLPLELGVALAVLFFLFFLVTQLLEEAEVTRREKRKKKEFPAMMWIRGVCLVNILLGVAIMAGTYREGDEWWVIAISGVFIPLGYFGCPRTIYIAEHEIGQRNRFIGTKVIPIAEIESVSWDESSGEITVFGSNGTRISHTPQHMYRMQFLDEMEVLTRKEVASLSALPV
jgi:hypothetical protein